MMSKPGRDASIAEDIKMAMGAFPQVYDHPRGRGAILLTEQELKVAELTGLGMTNKDIGDVLFISPLTVRTHVKRIHAKCGIVGRGRLAIVMFNIWDKGLYVESKKQRKEIMAERKAERDKRKSVLKDMVC
jgi:DNA-binding CsgD family transcriptional regulator